MGEEFDQWRRIDAKTDLYYICLDLLTFIPFLAVFVLNLYIEFPKNYCYHWCYCLICHSELSQRCQEMPKIYEKR